MTTRCVQDCSTSDSRWLETITVRPPAAYRTITSRISLICGGSRPFVGSSRISRSGSPSIACAIASRCRMPCEYVRTARSSASPSPAISRASAMCASSAGRPVACQYSSRLARPDRCGRNPAPSTNAPTRDSTGAPGRTGCPNTRISPASGEISPISIRSVVVFPAPFGPSSPSTCPFSTRNDRSRTAYRSWAFAYRFVRPVMSRGTPDSAGSGCAAPARVRAPSRPGRRMPSSAAASSAAPSGSPQVQAGSPAGAVRTPSATGTASGPRRDTVYEAGAAGDA